MKTYIIILCVCLSNVFLSQTKCDFYFDTIVKKKIYTKCDSSVIFKGGIKEYVNYLTVKIKPKDVSELQGSIRFFLLIDETGKVIYVGFYNKPKFETSIPEQIKKVFIKKKVWYPAKCNGQKVAFRFEGIYSIRANQPRGPN